MCGLSNGPLIPPKTPSAVQQATLEPGDTGDESENIGIGSFDPGLQHAGVNPQHESHDDESYAAVSVTDSDTPTICTATQARTTANECSDVSAAHNGDRSSETEISGDQPNDRPTVSDILQPLKAG